MANSKENLKSLSEIFSDTVNFVVPDYQRGYSWGPEQLDDLWEDLENLTESRVHYTGMFTFCKSEKGKNTYEIVDGQQRMTTLIILINELLSRINGGISGGKKVEYYKEKYLYSNLYGTLELEYKFQYSVDNPSDMYFKTVILGQKDTGAFSQPENTLYTRNLSFAKKYFKEKIEKYDQNKLSELFLKVTERLKFNEYIIDDINDVYVTFETMNNRGKGLSTLELLKNRLIYLSTLYWDLDPVCENGEDTQHLEHQRQIRHRNVVALRTHINNTWKTIYEYLGKSSEKLLNDDTFLKDHWIMYFRYDRSASKVFRKDLLSNYFTAKRVLSGQLSIGEVDEYVCNLQASVVVWYNINCPSESTIDDEQKKKLIRLNRVGLGYFKPLLMAAYLKSYNDMTGLIDACERYRFLVMVVTERRSNTRDSHFYKMANDYFKSSDNKSINLTDDVVRQTNDWTDISNFVKNSVDRYKRDMGFYKWKGIRYFLYEYEKYLQSDNEEKVDWKMVEKNQNDKITIEHVFPQTADDPYWTERFGDSVLLHSLGNLLLLSRSKNSELQNHPFNKKKKTSRDENGNIVYNGYDTGSHSEIYVANEYEEWTPSAIQDRGKKMLEFLKVHWNINHDFTDDEVKKLLNLSGEKPIVYEGQDNEPGLISEDDDD